jgi:hypothetical protein
VQDINDNRDKNFNLSNSGEAEAASHLTYELDFPASSPGGASDIAVCARSWRWEWFAMFFQFVIVAAGVVTMCPKRLLCARFPLAVMLAITTVVIMVSRLLGFLVGLLFLGFSCTILLIPVSSELCHRLCGTVSVALHSLLAICHICNE